MISKTQIVERTKNKTNKYLIETIDLARKNNLLEVAKRLSGPKRLQNDMNVEELNKLEGNNFMVIGKILSNGEIKKKITISALGFSEKAREKLKNASCEIRTIKEEIEKNPKLNGVKIL